VHSLYPGARWEIATGSVVTSLACPVSLHLVVENLCLALLLPSSVFALPQRKRSWSSAEYSGSTTCSLDEEVDIAST
jgi:hypothetical protein